MAMHNLVLVPETTIDIVLSGGWVTTPLKIIHGDGNIVEVYAQSDAGATLDAIGIGDFPEFSDTTPPQECAYYATGEVVAADPVTFGYADLVEIGGIIGGGTSNTTYLGLKGTGTVSFTIKAAVRP